MIPRSAIEYGWAYHPWSYEPVWVRECSSFKAAKVHPDE